MLYYAYCDILRLLCYTMPTVPQQACYIFHTALVCCTDAALRLQCHTTPSAMPKQPKGGTLAESEEH